jgi:hypothetical protein
VDGETQYEIGETMKRFTYRRQIKVSTADLNAALAGRKRCTIRAGIADVDGTELDLTDGRVRARVRIREVDHSKTLALLSDREVGGEGFRTKEELERDLRQYYKTLRPDDPLTVIWFELVTPQTAPPAA